MMFGLVFLALAVGLPPLLQPLTHSSANMSGVVVTTIANQNISATVTGSEVNYSGTFYVGFITSACSTGTHICVPAESGFYYLATNSSAYRLIPTSSPLNFADGTRVTVTGILVAPSSLNATLTNGSTLVGDIYVQSIRAA
jgi:hypothetical protein